MKFSHLSVWWAPLALMLAAGCANPLIAGPGPFSRIVTSQVGNGPAHATVDLSTADFRLASLAHHWATNDVYEFDVTLNVRNASGTFVAMSPPSLITLSQKTTSPSRTATFTGLNHGYYEASVVAKGNDGGTAASQTLTPAATAALDLTTLDTADATCTLAFDAVAFDATDTVTLRNPTSDGVFASPTAAATITVK